MDVLKFLLPPFIASLILTGIHAYLGVHVVERGVIFVDIALAQIAALGGAVAILLGMDIHGQGGYAAYLVSLAFTFLGAAVIPYCALATAGFARKRLSGLPMRLPPPQPSWP